MKLRIAVSSGREGEAHGAGVVGVWASIRRGLLGVWQCSFLKQNAEYMGVLILLLFLKLHIYILCTLLN